MKSQEDIVEKLLEIFPQLTRSEAMTLGSSGDPFSILVERVLNNNIERPYSEIKLFQNYYNDVSNLKNYNYTGSLKSIKKKYNNPTVFEILSADINKKIEYYRSEAKIIQDEIKDCMNNADKCPDTAKPYYINKADSLREKADYFNKQAVMLLIRLAIKKNRVVDFHGFFVKEALLFLDDLYLYYGFKRITIITGRKDKSHKLRPAVEKWFTNNGFDFFDDGPKIIGIERK